MTSLRRFALAITPFFILGACSELIGLSDFEKGDPPEGEGGEESSGGKGATSGNGGTSGGQTGGSSGAGRGGSGTGGSGQGGTGDTGPGGESGEAGMGGEPPEGGTGGMTGGKGGSAGAGRGGMGGAGMGGMGGGGAGGGGAGGGGAGTAGGGMGGSGGGACSTVTVPFRAAGFDSDTTAWVPYDDGMGPSRPIIVAATNLGITAQSPANIAHLGGDNGTPTEYYYAGMFQEIAIPAGAITLTLSGYRQVRTEESSTSTVYDRMAIQLYEDALAATGYIGQFQTFSNVTTPLNTWATFTSSLAIAAYAGQTVDFDMWAECDESLISDFFIDSLSLTAFVCP